MSFPFPKTNASVRAIISCSPRWVRETFAGFSPFHLLTEAPGPSVIPITTCDFSTDQVLDDYLSELINIP